MRNRNTLTWRQVIAGSLIALGLAAALANLGKAQMAKADETPPAACREQKNSPGADKESNWLPAADGQFFMTCARTCRRKTS